MEIDDAQLHPVAKSTEIDANHLELRIGAGPLESTHRLLLQSGEPRGGGLTQTAMLPGTMQQDRDVNRCLRRGKPLAFIVGQGGDVPLEIITITLRRFVRFLGCLRRVRNRYLLDVSGRRRSQSAL